LETKLENYANEYLETINKVTTRYKVSRTAKDLLEKAVEGKKKNPIFEFKLIKVTNTK